MSPQIQDQPTYTDRFVQVGSGSHSQFWRSNDKPAQDIDSAADRHRVQLIFTPHHGTAAPARLACQYRIRDLQNPRLQLVDDLIVAVDVVDGVYAAYCHDLDEFGSGSSEAEALQDFRAAVAELYFLLKEEGEAKLGPLPLAHWSYLKRIVREV